MPSRAEITALLEDGWKIEEKTSRPGRDGYRAVLLTKEDNHPAET